ncbi:MAG TPA: CBS domain-containing protein [Myxococcaceae bacterium]|nr:CBS domain-containing protein [Myxococcaceae bacterium]
MTSTFTVTVLPTDTLVSALRVMERHRVQLLPVMEETGRLLGLVSEAHILQAWTEDPLQPVAGVMAACGMPGEEEEEEDEWLLGAAELREWQWDSRWERASGT